MEEHMIKDLLPHYYAAHGMNPTFKNVRSIIIDGHEVAWMEYRGTVTYDITGEGRAGQPYLGRKLYCECHFTEGVGWEKDATHGVVGLMGPDCCVRRKAAIHLRHLELREEYLERFAPGSRDPYSLQKHTKEIIFDLIERVKRGEFIGENGNGAAFWGGYFYLTTVASIMDGYHDLRVVRSLVDAKLIGMNGAIVTPYRVPAAPRWDESFSITEGSWRGVAYLPTHADMPQVWHFKLFFKDEPFVDTDSTELPLMHPCHFGVDVEDGGRAHAHLKQLIRRAKVSKRIKTKKKT